MLIEQPILSIGMPVYNGAKFIREALDSLLTQTFTDFELIISDNASTDDTEAICREYASKDKRIRYIRQQENLGAAANFKFVLDEAKGEYFMWAACDDVWDSKWIEILLPIAATSHCIAFGSIQSINVKGTSLQHPANKRKFNFNGQRFIRRLHYYLTPPLLGKANPIYGIYPKYLVSHKTFDILTKQKLGVDMLFLYALLSYTEIKCDKSVVLYKRIHEDSCGMKVTHNSKWRLLLHNLLYEFRRLKDYSSLSNFFERLAIFFLFPIAFSLNMYFTIRQKVMSLSYKFWCRVFTFCYFGLIFTY